MNQVQDEAAWSEPGLETLVLTRTEPDYRHSRRNRLVLAEPFQGIEREECLVDGQADKAMMYSGSGAVQLIAFGWSSGNGGRGRSTGRNHSYVGGGTSPSTTYPGTTFSRFFASATFTFSFMVHRSPFTSSAHPIRRSLNIRSPRSRKLPQPKGSNQQVEEGICQGRIVNTSREKTV